MHRDRDEYQDVQGERLSRSERIAEALVGFSLLIVLFVGTQIAGLSARQSSAIALGVAGVLWPTTFRWLRLRRRRHD